MRYSGFILLAAASGIEAVALDPRVTSLGPSATATEADWFQTRPQSYQGKKHCHYIVKTVSHTSNTGVTATGTAPMLAETNPAPFGQKTYVPNAPLETSEPIKGAKNRNIFHLMGNLRYVHSSTTM